MKKARICQLSSRGIYNPDAGRPRALSTCKDCCLLVTLAVWARPYGCGARFAHVKFHYRKPKCLSLCKSKTGPIHKKCDVGLLSTTTVSRRPHSKEFAITRPSRRTRALWKQKKRKRKKRPAIVSQDQDTPMIMFASPMKYPLAVCPK